jgi:hypothetical protein
MEGPLDAGAVVLAERADPLEDVQQVAPLDLVIAEPHHAIGEARLRRPPEVENDLHQVGRGQGARGRA